MRPPAARMNVFAMPPPTISVSTFAPSVRRSVSLDETLVPPTNQHDFAPQQFAEARRDRRERVGVFGSALNGHLHFHCAATDSLFAPTPTGNHFGAPPASSRIEPIPSSGSGTPAFTS
jgi:hypothetical protein